MFSICALIDSLNAARLAPRESGPEALSGVCLHLVTVKTPKKPSPAFFFLLLLLLSARDVRYLLSLGEPGRAGENRARASALLNVNIY